jgi:hypothetical protein
MLAEFEMMESDASVILGGIAIVDLEDMGFELISQSTPQMLKFENI